MNEHQHTHTNARNRCVIETMNACRHAHTGAHQRTQRSCTYCDIWQSWQSCAVAAVMAQSNSPRAVRFRINAKRNERQQKTQVHQTHQRTSAAQRTPDNLIKDNAPGPGHMCQLERAGSGAPMNDIKLQVHSWWCNAFRKTVHGRRSAPAVPLVLLACASLARARVCACVCEPKNRCKSHAPCDHARFPFASRTRSTRTHTAPHTHTE